mgnify:FL=1
MCVIKQLNLELFQKSIRPNILISILVIVSYLTILFLDRHAGMPLFIVQLFAISQIFSGKIDIIHSVPILLITIGQLVFLFLSFRKVNGFQTIILLASPILINIGLMIIFNGIKNQYLDSTYLSTIPFWTCNIIFYILFLLKVKRHTTQG